MDKFKFKQNQDQQKIKGYFMQFKAISRQKKSRKHILFSDFCSMAEV